MDDDRPWVALAACRDADPEVFFSNGDAAGTAVALRICAGCPVAEECLEWALLARASFGVWGGTTEQERRRLLRRSA
jgi:WhiB family redox-sensing transcriptional regulator